MLILSAAAPLHNTPQNSPSWPTRAPSLGLAAHVTWMTLLRACLCPSPSSTLDCSFEPNNLQTQTLRKDVAKASRAAHRKVWVAHFVAWLGHLGCYLGQYWRRLNHLWAILLAILDLFCSVLAQVWRILETSWLHWLPPSGPSGSHLGPIWTHLRPSGAHLHPSAAYLRPSGAYLRPSGAHLPPICAHLGPICAHLGPIWGLSGPIWRPSGAHQELWCAIYFRTIVPHHGSAP